MKIVFRNDEIGVRKNLVINCDVLELYLLMVYSQSRLLRRSDFDFLDSSTVYETVRSPILSGIEIHDYFHGLASFRAVLNICF